MKKFEDLMSVNNEIKNITGGMADWNKLKK